MDRKSRSAPPGNAARPAERTRVAESFAPGHITGLFAPRLRERDPRARGSVGAGLVLDAGVTAVARWTPGGKDRVAVRSSLTTPLPISTEVATRLKGRRQGRLEVSLEHELPVGQGFGMSAAGALATGIAVATAVGIPSRRAVEVAHLADLLGGGGLGGVAAILGGGLEIRRTAGVPPHGTVARTPFGRPVFVSVLGPPIPSPEVLRNAAFLRRLDALTSGELAAPRRLATPDGFLAAAERFTDEVGLGPEDLLRTIRSLRGPGIRVAQTMFGHALFAAPANDAARTRLVAALEAGGLPAVEVGVIPPSTETL